jgi:hypothetical protein
MRSRRPDERVDVLSSRLRHARDSSHRRR